MGGKTRQAGFSLIEVMIVLVIVAVIMAIAIPMMREAVVRGMIGSATAEARTIHNALKRYHVDIGAYPDQAGFDTATFEPLASMGYYDGRLAPRILNGALDGYGSPSGGHEYWLEFTLLHEPSVRFLVADSDDGPLSGGAFHDGILYFRNGVLQPL
jgi:prepilin-type N-terminal cleavage/methylation domain-containing protein